MAKHFRLTIEDGAFSWARRQDAIERETAVDGIYVIRTSQTPQELSAPDAVRKYKSLAVVERAFRCLKGVDLLVRPIHHHTEDHVRAHVFLCMLAYYVEWHMREALGPLLFHDDELKTDRARRDPVDAATGAGLRAAWAVASRRKTQPTRRPSYSAGYGSIGEATSV